MQLYVDESGDPGMKTASGSSHYFLVATLIIGDLVRVSGKPYALLQRFFRGIW
jgi:hypothetical protein